MHILLNLCTVLAPWEDCAPRSDSSSVTKTTSVKQTPDIYQGGSCRVHVNNQLRVYDGTVSRRMDGFSPEGARVGSCDDTGGARLRRESTKSHLLPTSLHKSRT